MAKSKIEWTDATWNPVRGCTKISPGCKHCYASAFAERFRGVPGHPYELGFDLRIVPDKLLEPLKWSAANMVFVNSMSDLFHPEIPDSFVIQVAEVMMRANWHTYQVLTKRADRLEKLLSGPLKFATESQHIWWGVSVEDVKHGVPRIERLRNTPAAIKFLSVEPLLEDLGEVDLRGIDWMIVGGESGRGARPIEESWVLNLQKACRKDRIPFFFKQWGGVHKKKTGRELRGKTYDQFPATSNPPIPTRAERQGIMTELQRRLIEPHELQQISH
ncbi:MAG: phage Gp37/Gp68 family protein [Acidobacteriota bacterium]|jgi:protein gp37|nr:phage Gp37/Gp68 family protein [Acidobacteriota bacterium]